MTLRRLKDADVALKPQKYAFSTNRTDYLDHIISPSRLEVANHIADAIRELEIPITVPQLQSILRLCNVFKRLVLNFARIVSPFQALLKQIQAKDLRAVEKDDLEA